MFGSLRFFLALLVMVAHIGQGPGYPAHYSVWAFYTLSGFLMILVADRKFGPDLKGSISFLLNRFLRIFPTYWMIILISTLLILWVGEGFSGEFRKAMTLPHNARDLANNLFLFQLDHIYPVRISPPTWALRIELFYYILIGFVFSKSKKLVILWFASSLAYTIYQSIIGHEFYYLMAGCSLAFSSGGLLYHYIDQFKKISLSYITGLILSVGVFCFWLVMVYLTQIEKYTYGLIVTTLVIVICLIVLFYTTTENTFLKKIDHYLGSLSYPLYLFHWPVSLIPAYYLGLERGLVCFVISLPLVLLCSHFVAIYVEKPIALLRSKHFSSK